MALKRGISSWKNRSKGFHFSVLIFVLLCVLAPVVLFFGWGLYAAADQSDISAVPNKQVAKWREWQTLQDLKSLFSKEASSYL
ncbi:putative polygalacturonate 4-alpha-galacturonosyltransferase [Lupinus albus]|uniref:Putative polygalacturonate 4-alpha-galacturonosyltransferase n=1 Tax=Lupinus albus TaxID=3870 RepID=A0A6A4PVS4_LUPAL|nr:putative polygalacturonate 4-alpha-galacturonosyltransferase [Lupinus albus]